MKELVIGPYQPTDAWLIPFLSYIRESPRTILRNERVDTLEMFMGGYVQARLDLGLAPYGADEADLLARFDEWLVGRLGVRRARGWPGNCWPSYVRQVDRSSTNLKTFFKLFEEFLETIGRRLPTRRELPRPWPPTTCPLELSTAKPWSPR